MPKFRLLGGRHTDENGKVYDAGDGVGRRPQKRVIVVSDKPLDEMFRNKFERLDGPTKNGPDGEASEADATDDAPEVVKQRMTSDKEDRKNRKDRMSNRERDAIMTEEVDEEGDTEESKPVRQAATKKSEERTASFKKKMQADDDTADAEEEALEDAESEAEEAPKPARRGRASRAKKTR